jgi:hypothetical protein
MGYPSIGPAYWLWSEGIARPTIAKPAGDQSMGATEQFVTGTAPPSK